MVSPQWKERTIMSNVIQIHRFLAPHVHSRLALRERFSQTHTNHREISFIQYQSVAQVDICPALAIISLSALEKNSVKSHDFLGGFGFDSHALPPKVFAVGLTPVAFGTT